MMHTSTTDIHVGHKVAPYALCHRTRGSETSGTYQRVQLYMHVYMNRAPEFIEKQKVHVIPLPLYTRATNPSRPSCQQLPLSRHQGLRPDFAPEGNRRLHPVERPRPKAGLYPISWLRFAAG